MGKKTKIIITLGIISFVISVLVKMMSGGGAEDMTALERYYKNDIEGLQIETKLGDTVTALSAAANEYTEAANQGVEPDWAVLEPKFNDAIKMLESQKEEVEKIVVEDEKVKEVHGYLISSYDEMINGYKELVIGLKDQDQEKILSANDKLVKGQEAVAKWEQLLNEK